MLKVFCGLKDLLSKVNEDVVVDGAAFRLHSVITATLLFGCSLIITATQFVGTPIQCLVNGLPVHPVNTYCWIMSTFTIPKAYAKDHPQITPHPGISSDYDDDSNRKYHSYYQWVCFVLFFQGIAFYLPKWIWDNWEGRLMKTLVAGLNHHHLVIENRETKRDRLLIYLIDHIKRHKLYALKYWLCELMCLVNVFCQMYAMNVFFSGEFYDYGLRVIRLLEDKQENRMDPMVYIFPRVTKCTFHKYGASGTIQRHDALCVLPLNIVNEKTYVIIWFWFAIMAFILSVLFCYRIALVTLPSIRPRLLHINRNVVSKREIEIVGRTIDIGDWWVLYMLGKNLDSLIYSEIIIDLAKKFDDSIEESTMKVR